MASTIPARDNAPGQSLSPNALPPVENGNSNNPQTNPGRRTSLGFLRRAKSTEPLGERKASGGRMSKKMLKEQAREEELRRQREAAAVPKNAPRLPDLAPPPQLKTFGGENARPDSFAIMSNRLTHYQKPEQAQPALAAPAIPQAPRSSHSAVTGEYVDPYARTESMTHRGRYSYASSAVSTINSPRRVRRRKDPTPYNVLVIGARSSGKTSFLNFLRKSLALPPKKRPTRSPEEMDDLPRSAPDSIFTCHYLETEIDSERVGLTLWDSQGLEKNIVDLQLREITGFLESKFEDTFAEEMKVIRSPGVRDTHIHCAFLILDPARLDANIEAAKKARSGDDGPLIIGGLDDALDLQVLRTMQGKTTVVPVISKADTITTAHMAFLKKTVSDSLKKAGIDPLEILAFDEQDEDDMIQEEEEEEEEKEKEETKEDAEGEEALKPETLSNEQNKAAASLEGPPAKEPRRASSASISSGTTASEPLFPLSILSPDPHSLESNDEPVGRKFPWGFADPYNPEHCDFVKLKDSVFGDWRAELREASREVWYERWRTNRLHRHGIPAGYKNGMPRDGRVTR